MSKLFPFTMISKPTRTTLALAMSSMIVLSGILPLTVVFSNAVLTAPAYANTAMMAAVHVPGGHKIINLEASNESVREVLHKLSDKAGFNLMMDDSVTGTLSLELNQVSVDDALQSIAALTGVQIVKKGGSIYLAIGGIAAGERGLDSQFSKLIKINYTNANRIAGILNDSILVTTEDDQADKASADSRTNSVVIVGSAKDIELAEQAIQKMDVPRQTKTFFLSHAQALDVAGMLTSSIFNDGRGTLQMQQGGGGGGAGGGGGGGAAGGGAAGGGLVGPGGQRMIPSPLRVEQETVQEGEGVNDFGGDDSSGALSRDITLRGTVKTSQMVNIMPDGVLVIPDTRTNSVTIMGTVHQIALAESLIPVMDAQLPQVAIEASLVEITESGVKELQNGMGVSLGDFSIGYNNQAQPLVAPNPFVTSAAAQPAGNGLVGLPTIDPADASSFGRSGIGYTSNSVSRRNDYALNVRALISKNKAKILANPTVIATHDTESVISIVDEIVRRATVEINQNSGLTTQTIELGEAGIVMDILPKIGEDGTVNMRLRPSVTTVRATTVDAIGNTVTLLSRRDLLTQAVRVRDGETIVIGGLVNEQDSLRNDKLPLLSQLPIIGALFRASSRTGSKTELVLMITPHILNSTNLTPVSYTSADGYAGQ